MASCLTFPLIHVCSAVLYVPRLPEAYRVWMGEIRTLEQWRAIYEVRDRLCAMARLKIGQLTWQCTSRVLVICCVTSPSSHANASTHGLLALQVEEVAYVDELKAKLLQRHAHSADGCCGAKEGAAAAVSGDGVADGGAAANGAAGPRPVLVLKGLNSDSKSWAQPGACGRLDGVVRRINTERLHGVHSPPRPLSSPLPSASFPGLEDKAAFAVDDSPAMLWEAICECRVFKSPKEVEVRRRPPPCCYCCCCRAGGRW
jgi:hypothetical protein